MTISRINNIVSFIIIITEDTLYEKIKLVLVAAITASAMALTGTSIANARSLSGYTYAATNGIRVNEAFRSYITDIGGPEILLIL